MLCIDKMTFTGVQDWRLVKTNFLNCCLLQKFLTYCNVLPFIGLVYVIWCLFGYSCEDVLNV